MLQCENKFLVRTAQTVTKSSHITVQHHRISFSIDLINTKLISLTMEPLF